MSKREALHQKSGKANFELVYGLEDPREYFKTLGQFDYCIPQHGQRVFSTLIEARREQGHNGHGERQTGVVGWSASRCSPTSRDSNSSPGYGMSTVRRSAPQLAQESSPWMFSKPQDGQIMPARSPPSTSPRR